MQKCIQLLSIENPSLLRKLSCYVHKAFDVRTSSICVNIYLIFFYFFFIYLFAHKTMYLEKLRVSLSLTISVRLFVFLFSPNE